MSSSEPGCAVPDLGPDAYARWRASEIGAITDRLERQLILELVGDVSGCRVLDVGCGDGEFAVELAKRGAIVVGIDASPEMIDAANSRPKPQNAGVSFQVAMAEHLPPQQFGHLRRLLEARMGRKGKREYIQVLRLMELFARDVVAAAVNDAVKLGAIGFDAVKQLTLARVERRAPNLDLGAYPYLPKVHVATTRAADYAALLEGAAA